VARYPVLEFDDAAKQWGSFTEQLVVTIRRSGRFGILSAWANET